MGSIAARATRAEYFFFTRKTYSVTGCYYRMFGCIPECLSGTICPGTGKMMFWKRADFILHVCEDYGNPLNCGRRSGIVAGKTEANKPSVVRSADLQHPFWVDRMHISTG